MATRIKPKARQKATSKNNSYQGQRRTPHRQTSQMATTAIQKGLGNLNDYIKERFDGSKPSEFNNFVKQFQLGVDTLDIHPTKRYNVFINSLADPGEAEQAPAPKREKGEPTYSNRRRKSRRGRWKSTITGRDPVTKRRNYPPDYPIQSAFQRTVRGLRKQTRKTTRTTKTTRND